MVWEVISTEELVSSSWLKNYELAKKYYEEYGNMKTHEIAAMVQDRITKKINEVLNIS